MSYQDKYRHYLNELSDIKDYSKKYNRVPVLAYTSNLDVVLKWDVKKYNDILEEFLHEDEPFARPGDTMGTMEDFARISSFYIMQGLGGNFDITDISVCNYLKEHFSSEFSLGGTCAQGAAALGSLGFGVNCHLTDRCIQVCNMLDHEGTTAVKNGQIVPIKEVASDENPVYHFILQFHKDDKIKIGGREYTVPLSNRLILFFDTIHKTLPIDEGFLNFWERSDTSLSSYLLSGFDAIVDTKIIREKINVLKPHLKRLKTVHPDMIIYFEGAFYMNPEVKRMQLEELSECTDIIGMNEEELKDLTAREGLATDISVLADIVHGLDTLLKKYPAGGIVLHTKDYSMYYGRDLGNTDIEQGLTVGNLMSATRARIGQYGTERDCEESLSLPLSETGLRFANEAEKIMESEDAGDGNKQGRILVLVPSKYLEYPKYTIGLGDTFVSGVHTCFIRK